ncbi:MAG: hypothetical protein KJS97_05060 [Alphaproteobacteria bacterium]|nr:hypothetical protein [Alphaproteobacteria bacterium]
MRRLAVVVLALVALSGCGLRGKLEQPPPLFGPQRAAYEAEQKRKADEAAAKAAEAQGAAATPSGERQRTEIPVAPAQPAVKAPETLQPTPQASPFQRPN